MNKKFSYIIFLVVIVLSAFLSYKYFSKNGSLLTRGGSGNSGQPIVEPAESPTPSEPKTEECPMNGEMLTKSQKAVWEKHRPLIVMIENHLAARPQSGISFADITYEIVAEGGITRTMDIFYCKDTGNQYIGPIRSARYYFINFAEGYGENPLYTHVGGANCNKTTGSGCGDGAPADALGKLNKLGWTGYNDMDFVAFPVMFRDYERLKDVATEHTVYSTTKKLWDYAATKRKLTEVNEDGVRWDKNFRKWKFKEDAPAANPTKEISFSFWKSMPDYDVKWVYNKSSNSYLRFNGGEKHIDNDTKKQLEAKDVVVVFADESDAHDGYDAGQHLLYDVIGTGDAIIFQDGKAIKGKWEKKTEDTREVFYDENGNEIKFNRGHIFIEVLPTGNKVDY